MKGKPFFILIILLHLFQSAIFTEPEIVNKKKLKQIEKLMKKGDACTKKEEIDKAFEYYNKVLALSQEYAPVYLGFATLNAIQEDHEQAIKNLEKAIKIDPNFFPALLLYSKTLLKRAEEFRDQQNYNDANSCLIKVLNLPTATRVPGDQRREAVYQLGLNYFLLREFDKSNEYFFQVTQIPDIETFDKEKFYNSIYQIGLNFFNTRQFDKVEAYLTKLVNNEQLKPKYLRIYTMSHYILGLNASQLKQYKKSNGLLYKYLELIKNNPTDRYRHIANYMIGSNNYELLESKIEALKDDNIGKRINKIREMALESEDIKHYLERAIRENPNFELAYMKLGNYYYRCQDLTKAIDIYKTIITKFPDSPDIDSYRNFLNELEKSIKEKK
jgi:tetratricopeptide (TPR) repeat protein